MPTEVVRSRRKFLHLSASAVAFAAVSRSACAETYPSRPVHVIVGFPAGQAIDIVTRIVSQAVSERIGAQLVIENRPGAGGNIAAEAVVRAPADGYTLLVIGANNAINATLYDNLNFNIIRDLVPVAGFYRVPQVMVVNPTFPAKTVPEFIAYAKANPGKVNFGSAGNGSVAHVTGELFKMRADINMQHVPYRGAPQALTDLIAGEVQVMFDNLPSSLEHIRAGRLRALAVSTAARLETFPDLPTVSEFIAGFETSAFAGLGAPKGTAAETVAKLNHEINASLADATVRARISQIGGVPLSLSSEEFGKYLANETEKWAKVVRFSGAKPG
jgi:tripartite-type tricarboxylate transporter receptor subunit TctC